MAAVLAVCGAGCSGGETSGRPVSTTGAGDWSRTQLSTLVADTRNARQGIQVAVSTRLAPALQAAL
jgi:hypothetical protein